MLFPKKKKTCLMEKQELNQNLITLKTYGFCQTVLHSFYSDFGKKHNLKTRVPFAKVFRNEQGHEKNFCHVEISRHTPSDLKP